MTRRLIESAMQIHRDRPPVVRTVMVVHVLSVAVGAGGL